VNSVVREAAEAAVTPSPTSAPCIQRTGRKFRLINGAVSRLIITIFLHLVVCLTMARTKQTARKKIVRPLTNHEMKRYMGSFNSKGGVYSILIHNGLGLKLFPRWITSNG
jgi:hypothetical protein